MLRTQRLLQFQRMTRPTTVKQQQKVASQAHLKRATDEELRAELTALNRAPVLKSDPQRVLPALEEVKSRIKYVSPNNFRDAVVIANGSGHHEIAVELFVRRFETHRTDGQFGMVDAVVDSAFALGGTQPLLKLAELGSRRLLQVPDDFPTDLSMGRLLWRVGCLGAAHNNDQVQSAFKLVWDFISQYNKSAVFTQVNVPQLHRTIVRFAKYSERDMGEMLAFRHLALHEVTLCSQSKPLQYYVNALRSCRVSKADDQAQLYFDEYCSGRDNAEEMAIFTFLNVLQAAKAYSRIAAYGRKLFASGGKPSGSVLSVIAQASSEAGATDVVESAFQHVCAQCESSEPPSKYAAFACLVALGKCGGSDYLQRIDDFAERKLIDVSDESRAFLVIQHAVHSVDPMHAASEVLEKIYRDTACQTERVFNQLLQLYLRVDSPEFIKAYQMAVNRQFFRTQWIELLVTWADRRRYELTSDDRKYVLDEVKARRLNNSKNEDVVANSEGVAGLRPMLSILQHDVSCNAHNRSTSRAFPAEGPKLMDPRIYFLKSRKMNALELQPTTAVSSQITDHFAEQSLNETTFTKALRLLQNNQPSELREFTRTRPLPMQPI